VDELGSDLPGRFDDDEAADGLSDQYNYETRRRRNPPNRVMCRKQAVSIWGLSAGLSVSSSDFDYL
jgi:hypothetical protein